MQARIIWQVIQSRHTPFNRLPSIRLNKSSTAPIIHRKKTHGRNYPCTGSQLHILKTKLYILLSSPTM